MAAASQVASQRGLAGASLDEVAETAGFTKGAVYANFASKEELFLAMLDERFAERAQQIEHAFASDAGPTRQAEQAGRDFARFLAGDPAWMRLFFEMSLHATRDEAFRVALVARYRELREHITAVLQRRVDELGIEPSISARDAALMSFAMGNGVALEAMLEPDEVPDDLLPRMFGLLAGVLESSPPR